jgi:H+/Cl- antiporter ClcA
LQTKLKELLKSLALAGLSGVVSALAVSLFLTSLNTVTAFRELHSEIIWLLPIAGLSIAFLYSKVEARLSSGTSLILEEVHNPQNILPLKIAPLIFVSTLLSHLCGASVGREGVAVQMSTTLSDQISKIFSLDGAARKRLLICGMSAGFATALGTPWAGALFGVEVVHGGKFKKLALLESLVAAFAGYFISSSLGTEHSRFFLSERFSFNLSSFLWVALCGVLFGLIALSFAKITHFCEKKLSSCFKNQKYKIFSGGFLIAFLFFIEGSHRYLGLGIPYIQEALQAPSRFSDSIFKSFFSILSLSFGFKGGEFIPLVFIGSTLGSALSFFIPVSFQLLGAVGFAAVFAGAANAPLTCSVMAIEIFGWSVAPYALIACYASYFFSGQKGIYCSKDWGIFKKL